MTQTTATMELMNPHKRKPVLFAHQAGSAVIGVRVLQVTSKPVIVMILITAAQQTTHCQLFNRVSALRIGNAIIGALVTADKKPDIVMITIIAIQQPANHQRPNLALN